MDKGLFVKDIQPDQSASGLFIIRRSETRKTRAGGIFWSFLLVDASGEIEAKIWKPENSGLTVLPEAGSILDVESGSGSLFKNICQLIVEKARLLTQVETASLDQSWFRPTSEKNAAEMWEELTALCEEEFQAPAWHDFVFSVFEDFELTAAFCSCPGAISVHHAYLGGLLEHTLSVFTLCRHFADHYPELDRKVLLAGALFHDLGKIREYAYAVDISATDEGRLLGHLTMGMLLLEPFLQRAKISESCKMQIKHLILSHHGELSFGACVEPMTQEAIALHFADNLDAKMAICRKQLAAHKGSEQWTDAIFALDGRRLFCPRASAEAPDQEHTLSEQSSKTASTGERLAAEQKPKQVSREKTVGSEQSQKDAKTTSALSSSSKDPRQNCVPVQSDNKAVQASETIRACQGTELMAGSEALTQSYEGFHRYEDTSLDSVPQEDLPTSLLSQWDEEDLARGELADYREGEADFVEPAAGRSNIGKETPKHADRSSVLAKSEASNKNAEQKMAKLTAGESEAARLGETFPQTPAEDSLGTQAVGTMESAGPEPKNSEKTQAEPASLSEQHQQTMTAATSLAKAFAVDPELHFCDEELLNTCSGSEDLPDLAELAQLKEALLTGENQAFAPVSEEPQEGKGRPKALAEEGDGAASLAKTAEAQTVEKPADMPSTEAKEQGVKPTVTVSSDKVLSTGQPSFARADTEGLPLSPASAQQSVNGDGEPHQERPDLTPFSVTSDDQTASASSKVSALPAWAQDPPKKKRASRKKQSTNESFSLFSSR
ncbi:MAG: HD domain-containing protein [Desulfovibrio sp.]|nr:HD domain-containing protein [Desulfovibrio sp.]